MNSHVRLKAGVGLLAAVLWSSLATADVGPRPAPCNVQGLGCTSCVERFGGDNDAGCAADALDAGLVLSDCTDRVGASETRHYCPSGVRVGRACGCAGSPDAFTAAAAVVLLGLRRRAR